LIIRKVALLFSIVLLLWYAKIDFDYGFSTFFEYVPYLAEAKLPAMAAHIKMVPFEEQKAWKTHNEYKTRMAAVMMLFYQRMGWHIWF
jgi:hypothetical protein